MFAQVQSLKPLKALLREAEAASVSQASPSVQRVVPLAPSGKFACMCCLELVALGLACESIRMYHVFQI
jgi:hypothetical protein